MVNWRLHHHRNYLASNGFWLKEKRRFRNRAGVFSSRVVCLQWQSLDFTAVLPEIIRVIWNWEMAVRCWGTKRHQEDKEDYQPSSLRLQIWDKCFASRKYACTLKRFCQVLLEKHKHTEKTSSMYFPSTSTYLRSIYLFECVFVDQFTVSNYISNYFKTFFQLLS